MLSVYASALAGLTFVACMLHAARADLLTMSIPNRLVLILAASYGAAAPWLGRSVLELGADLVGAAVVTAGGLVIFARGWMGGGDVKLAGATALWLGAEQIFPYLLVSAAIGSVLTLVLLLLRRWPLPRALAARAWALRLHKPETGVPYGIALAIAGVALLPRTSWMQASVFG